MKIIRIITKVNLIIAFVIGAILFLLYSNRSMMNDWESILGLRWIWVPVVIILLASFLYWRFFFRKKK